MGDLYRKKLLLEGFTWYIRMKKGCARARKRLFMSQQTVHSWQNLKGGRNGGKVPVKKNFIVDSKKPQVERERGTTKNQEAHRLAR